MNIKKAFLIIISFSLFAQPLAIAAQESIGSPGTLSTLFGNVGSLFSSKTNSVLTIGATAAGIFVALKYLHRYNQQCNYRKRICTLICQHPEMERTIVRRHGSRATGEGTRAAGLGYGGTAAAGIATGYATGREQTSGGATIADNTEEVTKESIKSKTQFNSQTELQAEVRRIANQCYNHCIPFKKDHKIVRSVDAYFAAQTTYNYDKLLDSLFGKWHLFW